MPELAQARVMQRSGVCTNEAFEIFSDIQGLKWALPTLERGASPFGHLGMETLV